MSQLNPTEITILLEEIAEGKANAEQQLVEFVFEELRAVAHGLMKNEREQTLQPTALVNEAFLRLKKDDVFSKSPDRRYFFAAAAQAMRRIIVEAARKRNAQKRGGEMVRHSLDNLLVQYEDKNIDLLALDEALNELSKLSEEQSQVVQLRWLVGMTIRETAEILNVSESKIEADWRMARAFLHKRLFENI
jgi:RNA polymerase sigma factor (TIGR02999 family)